MKNDGNFCYFCCCHIKIGLAIAYNLLILVMVLNLLVGFHHPRDLVVNGVLFIYMIAGIIINWKSRKWSLILIIILTPLVMAASITSNIFQLLNLSQMLQPWYESPIQDQASLELTFIITIISSATLTLILGMILFVNNLRLLSATDK